MAFLRSKKNKEAKADVAPVPAEKKASEAALKAPMANDSIVRPRVTEKATVKAEAHNAYTFEVAAHATKRSIAEAVKEAYKVTPIKVNIVRLPAKQVFVRGKKGVKQGVKKAYIYLKKGETIEIA